MEKITIMVSGVTFNVNKQLLLDSTHYFEALLSKNFRENLQDKIVLEDVSAEAFGDLLKYLSDYSNKKGMCATPRFYRLPAVFMLADMFCMDRLLRYLRKQFIENWFKIGESGKVLVMAEELRLDEECLHVIGKDFSHYLEKQLAKQEGHKPNRSILPKHVNKKVLTLDLLNTLLGSEKFWLAALKMFFGGYFHFMTQLLKLILVIFSKVKENDQTLFRTFVKRTRPETMDTVQFNEIISQSDIPKELKQIAEMVRKEGEDANKHRLRRLVSTGHCILFEPAVQCRCFLQLDLESWSWTRATEAQILCTHFHKYGGEDCTKNCLTRRKLNAIKTKYKSLGLMHCSAGTVGKNTCWFVMESSLSKGKYVFVFRDNSNEPEEIASLMNLRAVYSVVVENGEGVLYILAEPWDDFWCLGLFKYTVTDGSFVPLAKTVLTEQSFPNAMSDERLLRQECQAFLVDNKLHILLIVPTFGGEYATVQSIYLFSGSYDISAAAALDLNMVFSYKYKKPQNAVTSPSRIFWSVLQKRDKVLFALAHHTPFFMRYDMRKSEFRHLGFVPFLPEDYILHGVVLSF